MIEYERVVSGNVGLYESHRMKSIRSSEAVEATEFPG